MRLAIVPSTKSPASRHPPFEVVLSAMSGRERPPVVWHDKTEFFAQSSIPGIFQVRAEKKENGMQQVPDMQ